MAMNIVPLTLRWSDTTTFAELALAARDEQRACRLHQRYRYEDLRKDLAAFRSGEADALESLRQRFHRLAGSGGSYGFPRVTEIARAMEQLLRRRRGARFLIEGHTDAVGSAYSNQILSERRAESLKWVLVREYGIPQRVLETVGYGEQYLLVPTEREEWRNRRVTLRRIDEFVR